MHGPQTSPPFEGGSGAAGGTAQGNQCSLVPCTMRTGKISGKTEHRAVRAWVVHHLLLLFGGAGGWSWDRANPPPPRTVGSHSWDPEVLYHRQALHSTRSSFPGFIVPRVTQNQVHSALHLISASLSFSQCFFPKLAIPLKTLLWESHSQGRPWGDGGGEAVVFLLLLASSLEMPILPPVMNEEVPSLFCH